MFVQERFKQQGASELNIDLLGIDTVPRDPLVVSIRGKSKFLYSKPDVENPKKIRYHTKHTVTMKLRARYFWVSRKT